MSGWGRLPHEEEKGHEKKDEEERTGPDLSRENSVQQALLQHVGAGNGGDQSLLDVVDPEVVDPLVTANEMLNGAAQLEVDELDPDLLEDAVPIPEQSMGVFDLGPDDQMNVTSQGFITCVGLLLERSKPEGGKRAGFSHVNSDQPHQCGLDDLVDQVGTDGIQAFLSTVGDDEAEAESTLFAVLQFLQDRQIPLAGRAPMKDGNVMATLSGSEGPKFSSTTDSAVDDRMEDREQQMRSGNPAFDGIRALEAQQNLIAQAIRSGKISVEQGMLLAEALTEEEPPYPMAFHPDLGMGGCRGNQWRPPDDKDGTGGGTGMVS